MILSKQEPSEGWISKNNGRKTKIQHFFKSFFPDIYYYFIRIKQCNVDLTLLLCEQYFPVELFIMLYKVDLTFESVDEILKCHRSNESY